MNLAGCGGDVGREAAEQTRFDGETAARAARLQAAENFKEEQIKRIFIKAMPGWLRSKIMEQPPNTPVRDLCTFARQQMTIREMCRKDDYPEDGFNQIDTTISENMINALSKLTANQELMEKRLKSIDSAVKENVTNIDSSFKENVTNQSSPSHIQAGQTGVSNVQQQNQFPRTPTYAQQRNFNRYQYRPSMPNPQVFNSNNRNFGYAQAYNQARELNFRAPYFPRGYEPSNVRHQTMSQQYPAQQQSQQFQQYRQFRPQGDVRMPRGPYMPVTRATRVDCWLCGYPNHKASQCAQKSSFNSRGTSFPFNRQPKN